MPEEFGILVRMAMPPDLKTDGAVFFNFFYCKKPEKINRENELFLKIPKPRQEIIADLVQRKNLCGGHEFPELYAQEIYPLGSSAAVFFPRAKTVVESQFMPFRKFAEPAFLHLGIGTKINRAMALMLEKKFRGYKFRHSSQLSPSRISQLGKADIDPGVEHGIRDYRRLWGKYHRSLRKRHPQPKP